MTSYISYIKQKGERILLRFFLVLGCLSSLFCCGEEIGGGGTRRVTGSISPFEWRPAHSPYRIIIFRGLCITLITAQKRLAGRALGSTRGTRRDVILAIIRDNEIVIVVVVV
jgi:hypothetical protein